MYLRLLNVNSFILSFWWTLETRLKHLKFNAELLVNKKQRNVNQQVVVYKSFTNLSEFAMFWKYGMFLFAVIFLEHYFYEWCFFITARFTFFKVLRTFWPFYTYLRHLNLNWYFFFISTKTTKTLLEFLTSKLPKLTGEL